MDGYNAVVGIDEQALNIFVADFYAVARNQIFHKVIALAGRGLEPLVSLEYDVTGTPRIGFKPAPPAPALGSTSESASSLFELWVDHFELTLHYSGGAPATSLAGAVHATADLVSGVQTGFLVPRLTGATVNIEGEQKLSEIFNKVVSPHLDQFLQEKLLDPIRVPVLRAGDVALNGPTLATSEERLLLTAALAPAFAAPAPLQSGWPEGVVFVAADFTLVNALAAQQLHKIATMSGEWHKTIKFVVGQTTIKAWYSATVTGLALAPVAGDSRQVAGTATINASVKVEAKNWFNARMGGASATATVIAEPVVNETHGLGVRLTGIKPFSLRFTFPGGAAPFGAYVETVSNAASTVLHGLISQAVGKLPQLNVGALPGFDIPVDDHVYRIQIAEPSVRVIQAAGRPFLAAMAVPDVQ